MVSYLAHLPWKSAESMPGGAMMVPPSTELPRKCGRWGGLWYLFLSTFHGNRRKACRVGRWMSHLPQNCRGSVAGGASVVSFLAHLPWKSAESMPGGAMMVSPSTELPRKCGRWVFRRSWKACLVGDLWYYSCPVYHHVESWSYSRRVIFTVMSRGVNKQKNRSRDSGTCFHYFM